MSQKDPIITVTAIQKPCGHWCSAFSILWPSGDGTFCENAKACFDTEARARAEAQKVADDIVSGAIPLMAMVEEASASTPGPNPNLH